jgi:hypothetical protein
MRCLLILAFATATLSAQHVLYACASATKNYVVGAKLPPSGLFRRGADGAWHQVGFNHPMLYGVDASASEIYLAAGNGLIRVAQPGERWTILTGSDITELRDVAADPGDPATVYFAYSHGIRVTHDGGKTFRELSSGLHRKYTETIRVDRHANALIAGGEEGVFRSEDGGASWRLAGAAGMQILRIEQSPHNACFWLAATQESGLFASRDCGKTFESSGRIAIGTNIYDIAFDPFDENRVALAAWGPGVLTSTDGGKTWQSRNGGLPTPEVTSVTYDPDKRGRLFAAIHELGAFVSENNGGSWTKCGLEETHVSRLRFLPGSR